jgi:hypothetical protein
VDLIEEVKVTKKILRIAVHIRRIATKQKGGWGS